MIEPESALVYGPADDDDAMLPLALGALSMLDTFAEAACMDALAGESEAVDDALLHAALGLLSLRRTLRRWADHAASDHAPPPRPSPRPAPPAHILR